MEYISGSNNFYNNSKKHVEGVTDDKSGVGEEVVYSIVPSYEDKETKEYAYSTSAKIDGKNMTFTLNKENVDIADGIYKVLFAIKDKSGNLSKMQSVGYYKFKMIILHILHIMDLDMNSIMIKMVICLILWLLIEPL